MFHGVRKDSAWATGVKMMRPELPVVIFAGDGDLASIGGNHMIQSCRRNLDVTVVMVNNMNFAMTGGQVAPTTPEEAHTMTTPYGSGEPRFVYASSRLPPVPRMWNGGPQRSPISNEKGHGTSLAAQGIFAD